MKKYFILALGLLLAPAIWADVENGDFSSNTLAEASTINVADDVDDGWSAYAASEYDLSEGDIYRDDNNVTTAGSWFGQIFTDNHSTYGEGTLEFDITWINDLSGAMFNYAIYGTDSTDSTATSFALNTDGNPLGSGSAWNLLDSGSISISEIMTDHQEDLNLGSTSYDYIAVRFSFDAPRASSRQPGSIAADNISVIPEPATIGLLCIGCVLTLTTSRIRRNRHQA